MAVKRPKRFESVIIGRDELDALRVAAVKADDLLHMILLDRAGAKPDMAASAAALAVVLDRLDELDNDNALSS